MAIFSEYKLRNPDLRKVMDIVTGHDHDGSNSKAVSVGTVTDGAVTNAKLATDVKVGSLASLNTTETGSVVGAINEVDTNADGAVTSAAAAVVTADAAEVTANAAAASAVDAGVKADAATAAAAAAASETGVETLTNKTLTAVKIVSGDGIFDAGGDELLKFTEDATPVNYIDIGSGDTSVPPSISAAGSDTNVDLLLKGQLTGNVYVADGTDSTKDLNFELGGATTAKTMTIISSQSDDRSLTLPDATDTLVGKATTDILTNKSLTSPLITDGDAGVSVTSADQTHATPVVTIPDIVDAADSFVMNDTAATLTLKTLTAPVITEPAVTYTLSAHDYAAGSADWTLSAPELLKKVHKPTNANAAVNAIIADTAGVIYVFINGTGQTLTVKTAAGSGVAITNAKVAQVMSDGTNVIALATESA